MNESKDLSTSGKDGTPLQESKGLATVKSKTELRAERRTQQEAQGAKKASKPMASSSSSATKTEAMTEKSLTARRDTLRTPKTMTADVPSIQIKDAKARARQHLPKRSTAQRQVQLFNHLLQYERDASLTKEIPLSSSSIHPEIIKVGIQYANGVFCGSNSRCLALLSAFKKVIMDYSTPPHKELNRDLDARLKPCISFLTQCRPLSVSMGNAIKHIKKHINNLPSDIPDFEAKSSLIAEIDKFKAEKIVLAGQAICQYVFDKISNGDVIVIYACSSLVIKVLSHAITKKQFRVIVVDARPKLEGKEALRRLVNAGIDCSYVHINAASYVMKEATKVLLGAHALLANGYVTSRAGTSMLALIGKASNVPVLVCCETYKFCERVQTDSFVFNELGDPDDLVTFGIRWRKKAILEDWKANEKLSLLNLMYDVTPAELISMVITELGMLPCTSVPVVLRVKQDKQ